MIDNLDGCEILKKKFPVPHPMVKRKLKSEKNFHFFLLRHFSNRIGMYEISLQYRKGMVPYIENYGQVSREDSSPSQIDCWREKFNYHFL